LVKFFVIWYIFPVLVFFTEKNLATLAHTCFDIYSTNVTGFWKRYHCFWRERLALDRAVPDLDLDDGLCRRILARIDPANNGFDTNLIRNGSAELVPQEVKVVGLKFPEAHS
jgi:hypothetical protein